MRVLHDVPKPVEGVLQDFKLFVESYVAKLPQARHMTFTEWLETTSYNESRKKMLADCFEECHGTHPTKRQASKVATHVKAEPYPSFKYGRLINSRTDKFKVFSGPLFKAIEEVVYDLPEFIKHVPVRDRPELIRNMRQAGRRFFQTDYSFYEAHFTPELMDACECVLYRHCLAWCPEAAEFLCSVIIGKNRCRTRTGNSCVMRGRRMSGDMCTSLGNGFTNLMLAKYIAHRKDAILTGFVEGDDGLFSCTTDLTVEEFAELGFTIKIVEVPDPCLASFCGIVCSSTGDIIRDPRRFMQTFGWTGSFLHARDKLLCGLQRAKALSAANETPNCPIVQAFIRRCLQDTNGSNPIYIEDGYHVNPPKDLRSVNLGEISSETRAIFEDLYHISVIDQMRAEALILVGDYSSLSKLIPALPDVARYARDYVVCT